MFLFQDVLYGICLPQQSQGEHWPVCEMVQHVPAHAAQHVVGNADHTGTGDFVQHKDTHISMPESILLMVV
jgi:hypothetical protein